MKVAKHLFYGIFIYLYCEYKGLVMLTMNLVIIFSIFTLCGIFLLLINEIDQILFIFLVNTTCRGRFVF
jgi:hypothetical protein